MHRAISTGFEKYLSSKTNSFIKDTNKWASRIDDGFLKLGQHGIGLGGHIAQIRGDKKGASKCYELSNIFSVSRDAISSFRFLFPLHQMFTGQIFWATGKTGWRRVKYQNGKPVRIAKADLVTNWTKQNNKTWKRLDGVRAETSQDGKYIDAKIGDPNGSYLIRDWMDVAMDILVFAARFFSPLSLLNQLKIIDLKDHAKWMGGVSFSLWTMVLSINLVQSGRDLVEEVDPSEIKSKTANVACSILDLISMPTGGPWTEVPGLKIAGAVLNIISALGTLITATMD